MNHPTVQEVPIAIFRLDGAPVQRLSHDDVRRSSVPGDTIAHRVRASKLTEVRLWRLTRAAHTALDGAGAAKYGGRYSPAGAPVVSFASEAGLAVLVSLRYLQGDPVDAPDDYVLGWTEVDAIPERVPDEGGDEAVRAWVTAWLEERRTLLAAVRSQVLPEANVVLMNPLHPDAAGVPPLVTRPFSFAECLHTPPMVTRYSGSPVE